MAAGSATVAGDAERALIAAARAGGVNDPTVLQAMASTPRRKFLPPEQKPYAAEDRPLPLGLEQTASQPSLVAWMTQLLQLKAGARVLEIGTGCGYQTAILAKTASHVFTIERLRQLHERSAPLLAKCGNVATRLGDGFHGWPEAAPFDGILLGCAPPTVPETLIEQLADGGRLVAPVGTDRQYLKVATRYRDAVRWERSWPVRFVPMLPNVR